MHRRTVLASLGGLVGVGLAGCRSAPDQESPTQTEERPASTLSNPGTWPQLAYDARNTNHAPDARGPREDAMIAWTSFGDRPLYPPVVDDDIFLTDAWTGGTAFAVAADDGTEQWMNRDLPPMRWAPALYEDLVIVISRAEGNVVRLHGLDTASGEQQWVRDDGITASSGQRPPTGPTVRDEFVYVGSNRGIIACEAATGAIEWTATLGNHVVEAEGGPTWRTDWATPAVTADRAFTFDMNESHGPTREVYAVDRASGQPDWTATLQVGDGWYLTGHVVAGSDRLFVSALKPHVSAGLEESEWSGSERLFALTTDSGDVDWDWSLSRKTLTPPAFADGHLYVGEWYPDADTGRLHALDVTDGSVVWTYETDAGGVRSPTVAGDTVYVSQGRELAAIAIDDGTRRWRLDVGALTGSPVVVGETIYVQTNPTHNDDSQLLAIREPRSG